MCRFFQGAGGAGAPWRRCAWSSRRASPGACVRSRSRRGRPVRDGGAGARGSGGPRGRGTWPAEPAAPSSAPVSGARRARRARRRRLRRGKVLALLGGYYSPLYPSAVAGIAATGLRLELAGRATALLAGLAALPLVHALARRCAGERAADAAVLVAAVHPALVKASAQVLPETLPGPLLLAWLVARRAAIAGALAGGAYLARPEGVLLLP